MHHVGEVCGKVKGSYRKRALTVRCADYTKNLYKYVLSTIQTLFYEKQLLLRNGSREQLLRRIFGVRLGRSAKACPKTRRVLLTTHKDKKASKNVRDFRCGVIIRATLLSQDFAFSVALLLRAVNLVLILKKDVSLSIIYENDE
jgi:hypothetical protein